MNRTIVRVGAAAGVLLFAAVLVQSFRGPGPAAPRRVRLEIPEPPAAPAPLPELRVAAPAARPNAGPERLFGFLERLGRARLVKDRRTLDELQRHPPDVFDADFEWMRGRLSGELFAAAGAAELLAGFRRQEAVPDLAAVLAGPGSPLLKDIVIESLSSLGGDAAAAALMQAARNQPEEGLRARAAAALAGFGGPEAYFTLAAALRDPAPVVRAAAAAALSRLPSRDAVDLLLRALAEERDPRLQADLGIAAHAAAGETWREAVVASLLARPALLAVFEERRRTRDGTRYSPDYPAAFFEPGQPAVPRPPGSRRVGITIETGPSVTLEEAASMLFGTAPFDRYRDWFLLRRAEEFPSPRSYDSFGRPAGESPIDELDGTVFLRFRDPKTFDPGILGFTRGCESFVSRVSLVHEFGHAFAKLGDEYAEGSTADAPNLARVAPAPWERLLPAPLRRDRSFLVPSADCHMANRPAPTRFCPVCQLEIHARMAQLAGAPLPW